MLCARNPAELEAQRERLAAAYPNARVVAQRADVSRQADVDSLFAAAADAFGRIDILVNNAGVYGPMGPIETIDWDEWVQAIAINLNGLVYCCRKAVEAFKPHRYGKIINLSGGGATNPLPGISAYAASKAAVVRFTETLALEVKEFGIDVNAVAPGALATRLTDQLIAAGPERVGAGLHERMSKLQQEGGTPLSVGASLCAYLASARKRWRNRPADRRAMGPMAVFRRHQGQDRQIRHLHAAADRAGRPRRVVGQEVMRLAIVGCGLIGRKRAVAAAGARDRCRLRPR